MSISAPVEAAAAAPGADRWTRYNATVLAICILGFAFDIYEGTIMQLVTPILLKEWHITPATIGNITTVSRWFGLVGVFVFPVLADVYGRKPILVIAILGYSLLTGLTGFVQGPGQMLVCVSLTRIWLSGETPVGTLMVSETAPTRWRATALGGLVSGYPFGYMLCSLTALAVVPLWGWRALYWIGILPALLVFWVRIGIPESPRFEHVTAAMLKEGLRRRLDLFAPVRAYPRQMLLATTLYFLYLFTWIGWSAWMPLYLANERHLGFKMMGQYLSVWMGAAIFAYWACGALCDRFGRRIVIPVFVIPAAALLVVMGHLETPASLFWVGLALNFLITGSFGAGLGYCAELFPTQIRGTAVGAAFCIGSGLASTSPAIMGWIATSHSIAAGLPLLALSFLLIAPVFYAARETTRRDLADFVGQTR